MVLEQILYEFVLHKKLRCTLDGSDDRMVICWLCHGVCIVGVMDARKRTGNKFLQIQNNLSHLNDEINVYGKLFNDFKNLDGLQSPAPSPTRRKSLRFVNTENSTTSSSCDSSAISLQTTPNIIENEGLIDNSTQFSDSKAVFPIPKNIDSVSGADRNKLLSVNLLPDPINSFD